MSLEIHDLHIEFPNQRVFDSVNIRIEDGEIIAIRTHVLDGGTSLLKGIAGFLTGVEGDVILDGQNVLDHPSRDLRHRIGFVYENHGLVSLFNVFQNIGLPLQFHTNKSEQEIADRIDSVCAQLELDEALYPLRPFELNDVQTRMINLARALVTEPRLLLIDELEGGMPDDIITDTMTRLRDWQRNSPMVVIITTASELVMHQADRVFSIKNFQLVEQTL
jgi:ABC-type sulfate/molybdate transport systems ATPase subunit